MSEPVMLISIKKVESKSGKGICSQDIQPTAAMPTYQEEVKGKVVFALFVQSFRINPEAPFEFVVLSGWKRWRLQDFAHLFAAETEVADRPHIVELDDFDLSVTPGKGTNIKTHRTFDNLGYRLGNILPFSLTNTILITISMFNNYM